MTAEEASIVKLLAPVLDAPGPFVSAYLNTSADTENGPKEIRLRWDALRESAIKDGADEASLDAIDGLLRDVHKKGDGLIAIASKGEIRFKKHTAVPLQDTISTGGVPALIPLAEWHQENPQFAMVIANRDSAEIHVMHPAELEEGVEVEGYEWPITRVAPGGWSQRRFQQRAENLWKENAKEFADALAYVVESTPIEFVLLTGDVRAMQFFTENVRDDLRELVIEMDPAQPYRIEEIGEEINKSVAEYIGRTSQEIIEVFAAEKGSDNRATDGWFDTFAALRSSQVSRLLITKDPRDATAHAVRGDPAQAATNAATLEEIGFSDLVAGPATDIACMAAIATGAQIWVLPDGVSGGPAEGVGALLRFA
jgi:Bacterial archaeo-eukaryotic release factor family 2